jgi:hypothetical protein
VDHILREVTVVNAPADGDVTVADAPVDGQESGPPPTAVPATRAMVAEDRPESVPPPAETLNRAQV